MDADDYADSMFGASGRTLGRHGYIAYFPAPLPRDLDLSAPTVRLLAEAESALGRLAGVGQLVPNPHLLMRPYVLREALSSTRIEGTQASMVELFELEASGDAPNEDVEEVLNYIEALEWGLGELERLPVSTRLLREMHRRLLAGVRGRDRTPGELRSTQNWIGGADSTIETARFVPPPPDELSRLLTDWEDFANAELELPILVQDALLHYQFETLHPFLDGNGRLGRLVIVFFLIARRRLPSPLLYLSAYLERDRQRYYDALQAPRESGDIEAWLTLFLEGVHSQSTDAVNRAEQVLQLREDYRRRASTIASGNASRLVEVVAESPILTSRLVQDRLGVTRPTALSLLGQLASLGILSEQAEGPRGQRRYVAPALLDALISESAHGG